MLTSILFEDNHLLVLDKPAGLLTQPAPHCIESLETQAKAWIKHTYHKPGQVYLHAIHRLDTPVSGIVVFAKTSKALSRLQADIRANKMEKLYRAWVEGVDIPETGILEHWLIHAEKRAKEGLPSNANAKKCLLKFRVLKRIAMRTLVEIQLETGRFHQIRAQWSLTEHPIWGDRKYGSQLIYPHEGIALQHYSFSLFHPVTKEKLIFQTQCASLDLV